MIPGANATQPFTATDAEALISVAASAPIANMQQAEARAQLFMRFRIFVAANLGVKHDAPAEKPAKGAKKAKGDEKPPAADPLE